MECLAGAFVKVEVKKNPLPHMLGSGQQKKNKHRNKKKKTKKRDKRKETKQSCS